MVLKLAMTMASLARRFGISAMCETALYPWPVSDTMPSGSSEYMKRARISDLSRYGFDEGVKGILVRSA